MPVEPHTFIEFVYTKFVSYIHRMRAQFVAYIHRMRQPHCNV